VPTAATTATPVATAAPVAPVAVSTPAPQAPAAANDSSNGKLTTTGNSSIAIVLSSAATDQIAGDTPVVVSDSPAPVADVATSGTSI
jgi:hypothetical protein